MAESVRENFDQLLSPILMNSYMEVQNIMLLINNINLVPTCSAMQCPSYGRKTGQKCPKYEESLRPQMLLLDWTDFDEIKHVVSDYSAD